VVDRIFLFTTAFGDSDAEDNVPDEDVQDNRDENHDVDGPDSMDQPSPPARVAHPQPDKPFDMVDFMHKSSSYDMQKVFDADDAALPRHVPSERPGGEARREILKSRAKDIPRSVSEVFAYVTSRTLSGQDTAVVLETFGNVRRNIELVYLWYIWLLFYLVL
jgi:hypothetical protein